MVERVRGFNRVVSERIGALGETYLGRGRPLGETRLLWEIGAGGADVRDLRRRLGIDAGYASRLLRSLEAEGMVARRCRHHRPADPARQPDAARTRRAGSARSALR